MTVTTRADGHPGLAANILWTWLLVAINLSTALFVSPLLVRRLGDNAYGLWALVFSAVEYFGLLDMGIRSALVKHVAERLARDDAAGVDRTLQAGVAYFACVGTVLLVVTLVCAPFGPRFFSVPPELASTFVQTSFIVGIGWAVGVAFQCLTAGLEAAQRFDLSNRAIILASLVRVVSMIALLQWGFGLTAVASAAVGARLLQGVLCCGFFVRVFPRFRFNPWAVNGAIFRSLLRFGVNTVPMTIGSMLHHQGPPVVIGHMMPVQFVGYYSLPGRLTATVLDLVYRAAAVTTARSAELSAYGRTDRLRELGVMSNRYSLLVFVPFAALLLIYGDRLFAIWLTPAFASASAPLLPIFVIGGLAEASQYNSGSILFGLGRHRVLAQLLLAEAVAGLLAIAAFIAMDSFRGAAAAAAALLVVNRGCLTPVLLCRQLGCPVGRYVTAVAARPMAVMIVTSLLLWCSRATWLPGDTFVQIVCAGALGAGCTLALAGRFCVLDEHRVLVMDLLRRRAPFASTPARYWLGVRSSSAAA